MPFDALDIKKDTSAWIEENGPIDGLFLTHIHLDHITGLPDIPAETPVYVGPGEPQASSFENMFVQGTVDGLLKHLDPLVELEIPEDPSGRLEGVVDVFGDRSFFAIHAPGHTPGHLAFLARTPDGPVLMTGDTSHTAWGWKNGVEPGTFSMNHDVNAESLERLKALEREIPDLTVYLGHQRLVDEPTAFR
jgi:glyoxylase-like metal-dependent hydrolase (beta-lactamase superfamily II)